MKWFSEKNDPKTGIFEAVSKNGGKCGAFSSLISLLKIFRLSSAILTLKTRNSGRNANVFFLKKIS
jgi:hypothetical protein